MIDIHTHILPGIDDGAGDIYDSLEMAQMAADSGVTTIVATPHCNIPRMYQNYFGKKYMEVYRETVQALKREQIPIKLLPGMEVYATDDLPDLILEKKIMPLNQSHYILMEFAFDEDPEFVDNLLERVWEIGAKPVIAHAERYDFVQDYPQMVYQWRKKEYAVQVNKGSFLGKFGNRPMTTAYRLLQHNLVNVIASDAHSPYRRTTHMADAFEELSTDYPQEYLDVLFRKNPYRICTNNPVLSLKPKPFYD